MIRNGSVPNPAITAHSSARRGTTLKISPPGTHQNARLQERRDQHGARQHRIARHPDLKQRVPIVAAGEGVKKLHQTSVVKVIVRANGTSSFTIDSAIPKTARVATAITRPCTQTVRNRRRSSNGACGSQAAASSHRGCWIDGEGEGGKPVCHQIDPENVDRKQAAATPGPCSPASPRPRSNCTTTDSERICECWHRYCALLQPRRRWRRSCRRSTISDASLVTSVPVTPMAIPMSASRTAGASLTPSPVIATTAPLCAPGPDDTKFVFRRHSRVHRHGPHLRGQLRIG